MLLPAEEIEEIEGFAIKLGKRCYYFRGGETPFNDSCSANIVSNKYYTNKILQAAEIPVAKAIVLHSSEFENNELEERIADLNFPLVVKPTVNGFRGRDVLCNIQTIDQLKHYLSATFSSYEYLTIEEFHGNLQSYRVLVFNQRVIGVVRRYPAHVIGDGKHTIEQLVELTNAQRAQISDALGKIVIDEECHIKLNELHLTPDYIPQQNERVSLGYTANASRGGTFESIGQQICPENSRIMIRAARALNLNITGIDVECVDINVPIETSSGIIIELNNCPSIKIHEIPMSGSPNRVSKQIVRSLIYRHPLSYLHVLYTNKRTVHFIRSLLIVIFFGLICMLLV